MATVDALPSSPALSPSPLRVIDYSPTYGDQVINLFVTGMTDNISASQDSVERDMISGFIPSAATTLRDIPSLVNAPGGGRFFLALSPNNDLVGMLAMARSDEDASNETVELTRISTARDWRRKGVCKALVAHAIREAVDEFAVSSVYLHTLSSFDAAMNTYSKLGFVLQGPRKWAKPSGVKFVMNVEGSGWWQKQPGRAGAPPVTEVVAQGVQAETGGGRGIAGH